MPRKWNNESQQFSNWQTGSLVVYVQLLVSGWPWPPPDTSIHSISRITGTNSAITMEYLWHEQQCSLILQRGAVFSLYTQQICLDKVAGTKFSLKYKNKLKYYQDYGCLLSVCSFKIHGCFRKVFLKTEVWTILVSPYMDMSVVELPPVVWIRPAIWLHSSPNHIVSSPDPTLSPSQGEKLINICPRTGDCSLVPSHEENWSGEPSQISWVSAHSCDNVT